MKKVIVAILPQLGIHLPVLLAVAFVVASCSACSPAADRVAKDQLLPANMRTVDTAVAMLRSGQVVLRTGLGADSYMLTQMSSRDKTYSHCGIVMVEHGYPFVYHSIGGEDNPDQRLRRDSAAFFFSPLHNSGIAIVDYNFTPAQVLDLRAAVLAWYRIRPRFDLHFDLATDDQLYCSEFVYKSILQALHDSSLVSRTTTLSSTYIAIDDLYHSTRANIVGRFKFK